jgi:hypothetical protein
MPKLIRLETGDWADPFEVRGIEVDPGADGQTTIALVLRGDGRIVINDLSEDGPFSLADRIAEQINAAVAPSGRLGPAGPDRPVGAW